LIRAAAYFFFFFYCVDIFKSSSPSPTKGTKILKFLLGSKLLQESALLCGSEIGCQLRWRKRYFLTGGTAEDGSRGKIIVTDAGIVVVEFFRRRIMRVAVYEVGSISQLASVHTWNAPSSTLLQLSLRKDLGPFSYKEGAWGVTSSNTIIHGQLFIWIMSCDLGYVWLKITAFIPFFRPSQNFNIFVPFVVEGDEDLNITTQ
jgi:hypothetical protein